MRRWLLPAAAAAALAAAPAAADEPLDAMLAARQAELAALTAQINQAAGADFAVERQIQLTLQISVLQAWAAQISDPEFTISAVGTAVEGDLAGRPGLFRVWIDAPADAAASFRMAPLRIESSGGGIEARTQLSAQAQLRVSFDVATVKSSVLCGTSLGTPQPVRARFALGAPAGSRVPYVATLVGPLSLRATVSCRLGGLPPLSFDFPIADLAGEIGRGEFDLGYSEAFTFTIPGDPPRTLRVPLTVHNPLLRTTDTAIEVGTDVEIGPSAPPG